MYATHPPAAQVSKLTLPCWRVGVSYLLFNPHHFQYGEHSYSSPVQRSINSASQILEVPRSSCDILKRSHCEENVGHRPCLYFQRLQVADSREELAGAISTGLAANFPRPRVAVPKEDSSQIPFLRRCILIRRIARNNQEV